MPKAKTKKKSKVSKKSGTKKAAKKVKAPKREKPIGAVTHYYSNLEVAIVKFKKAVKVGTKIQFRGTTTDFEETIKSMQYDHKPIMVAPKGKEIGIKVKDKVREGDEVFDSE
ncbi:MAG: translation elongation factor-like protein [Candidatus Liptonbacteria bacterium]|nr:translation elongation factor-like protein [Candidatus Liptonbacteria bacterium]